jgi:hypothetical protein
MGERDRVIYQLYTPSFHKEVGAATVRLADRKPERIGMGRNQDEMNAVRHQAVGPRLNFVLGSLFGEKVNIASCRKSAEQLGTTVA